MKQISTAWAVTWTEKAAEFYGADTNIISIEPKDEITFDTRKKKMGRPKIRYGEPLAMFPTKEEAEAYRSDNKDWLTIEVKIVNG
jgi:hypothetical protein